MNFRTFLRILLSRAKILSVRISDFPFDTTVIGIVQVLLLWQTTWIVCPTEASWIQLREVFASDKNKSRRVVTSFSSKKDSRRALLFHFHLLVLVFVFDIYFRRQALLRSASAAWYKIASSDFLITIIVCKHSPRWASRWYTSRTKRGKRSFLNFLVLLVIVVRRLCVFLNGCVD